MLLLRDNPNLLLAAIARVSEISGIPRDHVEKDFWLTECLRGLTSYGTSSNQLILFKGGTSLSKGFGLIRRFSEDADMVVVFGEGTVGAHDRHLKNFMQAAEQATGLTAVVEARSCTKGKTRNAELSYPGGSATPLVLPRVKIELHTVGGVAPCSVMDLSSILEQHWTQVNADASAADYVELNKFQVHVVDPCRTLIEKLVLLHEAHTRDQGTAMARQEVTVRHYYDVWCLLTDQTILTALKTTDVQLLAHDVATYSQAAGYVTARRPTGGFATSPAFTSAPSSGVRDAYTRVVTTLVWPNAPRPTLEECHAAVIALAPLL